MTHAAAGTLRIGVDVLDRTELRRLLARPWFLRLSYAPEEIRLADRMGEERRLEFLAGRFAAKEAVVKVLGTGLLRGIAPRDICVDRAADGAPVVTLRGPAAALGPAVIELSITHKHNVVAAVALGVVAPAGPPPARTLREDGAPMSLADTHQEAEASAFLRVRIGQEDAHYGGGLVDGAHILRLFGDLVTEITARTDEDEGLLAEYAGVRFLAPVRPGDYIEARARLVRATRLRRVVELEAHKVIEASPAQGPSAVRILPDPQLVCTATATTVIPMGKARTRAHGTGPATGAAPPTGAAPAPVAATAPVAQPAGGPDETAPRAAAPRAAAPRAAVPRPTPPRSAAPAGTAPRPYPPTTAKEER
ncbi:4'-phosphopantetheinyl transferase superfamily protein [Streptomyces reticuli]|uniref:4'-phosphopantetheinyl transferase superfamily protein n=1 Tax=Streptomyces reticuli TaxID=1926 RepID=UPI00073E0662|nr:4'-phosphopantetheinyl transferase superfamily protein [Streptomyces sp. SID7810]CUW26997.1 3-aminobutyryl-CoA ammonia lyase [Streptomyces reticuli]